MGTNTSLCPQYAYSPKGRRAYAQVPRKPRLKHGQIVVVNNLSAHKSERVSELLEE
jgi:hypothetical protein